MRYHPIRLFLESGVLQNCNAAGDVFQECNASKTVTQWRLQLMAEQRTVLLMLVI